MKKSNKIRTQYKNSVRISSNTYNKRQTEYGKRKNRKKIGEIKISCYLRFALKRHTHRKYRSKPSQLIKKKTHTKKNKVKEKVPWLSDWFALKNKLKRSLSLFYFCDIFRCYSLYFSLTYSSPNDKLNRLHFNWFQNTRFHKLNEKYRIATNGWKGKKTE